MTPEELDRERAEVADTIAGRPVEAAWLSTDGRTVRYRLGLDTEHEARLAAKEEAKR